MPRRKILGLLIVTFLASGAAEAANKRRLGLGNVSLRTLPGQTHIDTIKVRVPAKYLKRGATVWVMTRTGVADKASGAQMKWSPWTKSGVGRSTHEVGLIYPHPTNLINLAEQNCMVQIKPVVRFPSRTEIEGTTHIFDMLTHK